MKKIFILIAILGMFGISDVLAGTIQYIGTGRQFPPVNVKISRNNGATWNTVQVKPGQTFNVPRDATHLMINEVPRDPKKSYKVKEGNIS